MRNIITSKLATKVATMSSDFSPVPKRHLLVYGVNFRSISSNWSPLLMLFAQTGLCRVKKDYLLILASKNTMDRYLMSVAIRKCVNKTLVLTRLVFAQRVTIILVPLAPFMLCVTLHYSNIVICTCTATI